MGTSLPRAMLPHTGALLPLSWLQLHKRALAVDSARRIPAEHPHGRGAARADRNLLQHGGPGLLCEWGASVASCFGLVLVSCRLSADGRTRLREGLDLFASVGQAIVLSGVGWFAVLVLLSYAA